MYVENGNLLQLKVSGAYKERLSMGVLHTAKISSGFVLAIVGRNKFILKLQEFHDPWKAKQKI